MKKRKRTRASKPGSIIKLNEGQSEAVAVIYATLQKNFPEIEAADWDLTCYPKDIDLQSILYDIAHRSTRKYIAIAIEKGISPERFQSIDDGVKIATRHLSEPVVLLRNTPPTFF